MRQRPISAIAGCAALLKVQHRTGTSFRRARASQVSVRLAMDGDDLHVTVTDDGIGLPEHPRPGVGLGSMAERAAELGGRATITPAPGGGTRVHAVLPAGSPADPATDTEGVAGGPHPDLARG